jgi:hypothetical protein
MNIEPKPNAQMPIGIPRHVVGATAGACVIFEGGEFMRKAIEDCLRCATTGAYMATAAMRQMRLCSLHCKVASVHFASSTIWMVLSSTSLAT